MKNAKTPPSDRARIRRMPQRADYDRATIEAILDAGFVGHVAFVAEDSPALVPMIYARVGEEVILHGSAASRALRALLRGAPFCFSVTHVDGLVLARSAFHHSANFRSVVLHGRARAIVEPDEKHAILKALVERVIPGRPADVRGPSAKELTATAVVALPLDEAAAKVRVGGPEDEVEDLELPAWAGVVPLGLRASPPIPSDDLRSGIVRPAYLDAWVAARE